MPALAQATRAYRALKKAAFGASRVWNVKTSWFDLANIALLGLNLLMVTAATAGSLPTYQLLYETLGRLADQNTGWASVVDYGTSPGGRSLRLIKIQSPYW